MSYLVLCSLEVGGLPFAFAEAMNRNGVGTCYVSLAKAASGHDSSAFHHGSKTVSWDISRDILASEGQNDKETVENLCRARDRYGIRAAFATGSKAHLLHAASIPYAYWSYGSDLDHICHPVLPRTLTSLQEWRHFAYCVANCEAVTRSIRLAQQVTIAPYQQDRLHQVCPGKRLFFIPHLIHSGADYDELLATKSEARESLKKRFGAEELFFSCVRHCWSGWFARLTDNKRNDILIDAFAAYLKMRGFPPHKLVLVNKGPNVLESKARIRRRGIEQHVEWVTEMKRGELAQFFAGSSAVLGQFGTPVLTGAVLEPLAWATPSISYFNGTAEGVPYYETQPPVINANSIENLTEAMSSVIESSTQEYYANAGFKWISENCCEANFVAHAAQLLESCQLSSQRAVREF